MKTLSILLLALALSGCIPRPGDGTAYAPSVFKDAETGCEYLATGHAYGSRDASPRASTATA